MQDDVFELFPPDSQTLSETEEDRIFELMFGKKEDSRWEVSEEWRDESCELIISKGMTMHAKTYVATQPTRLERLFGSSFEKRLERMRAKAQAVADKDNAKEEATRLLKARYGRNQ